MFRVPVVDDDPDINEVVREGLRVAGYDPVPALSGEEALAEIGRQVPDLVLLDQMLPDIDGIELCRRLRANPRTQTMPVVFLTARSSSDARVRGLAVGADDYVVKPFSMQELVLRIRAILRRAAPVEMELPPDWVRLRDQFRVWNRYAEIHDDRIPRGGRAAEHRPFTRPRAPRGVPPHRVASSSPPRRRTRHPPRSRSCGRAARARRP